MRARAVCVLISGVFTWFSELSHYYSLLFSLSVGALTATALLVFWAILAFASSGFSLYWDICRDWGLGDREHMWLRANLLHSPLVYFWAIVSNALMRVVWIVNISPMTFGINISPPFLTMLVAAVEICRRFQWNIFRVENEFLNNCGKFRAVNVVAVPVAHVGGDDAVAASLQRVVSLPKMSFSPVARTPQESLDQHTAQGGDSGSPQWRADELHAFHSAVMTRSTSAALPMAPTTPTSLSDDEAAEVDAIDNFPAIACAAAAAAAATGAAHTTAASSSAVVAASWAAAAAVGAAPMRRQEVMELV